MLTECVPLPYAGKLLAQRDSQGKNKLTSLFCNATIHRQGTLAGLIKNLSGQYPRNNYME